MNRLSPDEERALIRLYLGHMVPFEMANRLIHLELLVLTADGWKPRPVAELLAQSLIDNKLARAKGLRNLARAIDLQLEFRRATARSRTRAEFDAATDGWFATCAKTHGEDEQ